MDPISTARRLRRNQTTSERELWQALRAGRFAGFKFRRQHPVGPYFLDFFCPQAGLSVELDGFQHGLPTERQRDLSREQFLAAQNIEELRIWNNDWKCNRTGVLWDIWQALCRRSGCRKVARMVENNRFEPPGMDQVIFGRPKS